MGDWGLGGLFSGIFNSVSQHLANKANLAAVEATNKANMDLAEYQWSKNLEMWNLQNEYNSPKAQMQRFIEAGLNPNLIYGKGSSGNATSLPSYSAPRMQAFNKQAVIMSQLGSIASLINIIKQGKLIDSQAEKNRADAAGTGLSSEVKKWVFDNITKVFDVDMKTLEKEYLTKGINLRDVEYSIKKFAKDFQDRYGVLPTSEIGQYVAIGSNPNLSENLESLVENILGSMVEAIFGTSKIGEWGKSLKNKAQQTLKMPDTELPNFSSEF